MSTITSRVQYWGEREAERAAFIFWGTSGRYVLSRGDVIDLSSRYASRLTRRGIVPGDVVCLALPNSPERIIVEFGIQLAGAVSMNGQVLRADGQDLVDAMKKTKSKLIVLDQQQPKGAWKVLSQFVKVLSTEQEQMSVQADEMPNLLHVEQCSIDRETNPFIIGLRSEGKMVFKERRPSDVASIFTTSGSSGYTKLVQHSHNTILKVGEMLQECIGLETVLFSPSPLGWAGGYAYRYLMTGFARVLLDASIPDQEELPYFIWNLICKEGLDVANLLPAHIDMIFENMKTRNLQDRRLKCIITGGQPMKAENFKALGYLTDSFRVFYGATELGYIASFKIDKDNISSFRNCSVGFPLPGYEVRIQKSPETSDSRGEIHIKSECLTLGYVESPDLSEAFLEDGWFNTGDVGYVAEDGCLVVEGRGSDAIIHGPYILYPTWLEEKLAKCPGVSKVVIVPVPDPVVYNEICACAVSEPEQEVTQENVLEFCKEQLALDENSLLNVLPKFVLFFDSFPLTVTGKLDRKMLKSLAVQKLGL